MSLEDKAKNAVEGAVGKAKEAFGKATEDVELETEGRVEQVKSDLKKAGEKIKDAFKH